MFDTFTQSDNPVIALLAIMVVVLSGVVVYQWKYTSTNTIPKWLWDSIIGKLEMVLQQQSQLLTILNERLKQ